MDKKYKIIFVCTDNYGRSIIAERILKDFLSKNHIDNFIVSSAGTDATSDISNFSIAHFNELKKLGIDNSMPKRIQLTKELAGSADLLIAFDDFHQEWIKKNLGINAPLYNEIYKNQKTPISCKEYEEDITTDEKMIRITEYIYKSIPILFENIKGLL